MTKKPPHCRTSQQENRASGTRRVPVLPPGALRPGGELGQTAITNVRFGARRNEITHARWEHVDPEASTLFVPLSKSGKSRYVFINAAAADVLASVPRLPDNPYIFPSPITGRPSASLHFPWRRIRRRAGLDDVRLHDLRHSFASALVNDGKDLYAVQRLLGHANAKATQRYAHLARKTLADAAEAMGKVVGPILKEVSRVSEEVIDDLSSGPPPTKWP